MSRITVIARIVAKQKSQEIVRSELLKLVSATRKEEGCLEYTLHQDNDNPLVFIFYENWKDESCLEKHMNSEHFRNYVSATDGMLDEKAVNKLTRIE
ncbi:MAG: putative quinol monooxygenase [Desulfobacteraceae bacterium]|nr:putative quinol monooxygenase [Desulfobacteraceae bacterium]